MRRRIAAAAVLVAGSSAMLTACDGELIDTIESAVPTGEITLPTGGIALPSITIGAGQGGGPAQTAPAPTVTQTVQPTETPTATEDTATTADSGISTWAWVLLAVALAVLVALLVTSARRRRGAAGKQLAAQAEGQLGWVQSATDDALVRWRAAQLGLPVEDRDTDSELARRWMLLDQRVTAATNDLLTLESSSKDEGLRQTATALREAAERYRTSVDALAQSVVTGDQSRISAASQALTADTTLLEQARQRLRQSAKL